MNEVLEEAIDLQVSDRCDLCGAQAFVKVVMQAGPLLFCAHHGRKFAPAYSQQAVEVKDYTHTLRA